MEKGPAIVIGSFTDDSKQKWSPFTRAYASVMDVISVLGDRDSYYRDLAETLHVAPDELPARLRQRDGRAEMDALVEVLRHRVGVAFKLFPSYRSAQAFISLLEQLNERDSGDSTLMSEDSVITDVHHSRRRRFHSLR